MGQRITRPGIMTGKGEEVGYLAKPTPPRERPRNLANETLASYLLDQPYYKQFERPADWPAPPPLNLPEIKQHKFWSFGKNKPVQPDKKET